MTIIIRHEDGREYGVSEEAFNDLYKPEGFVKVRDEADGRDITIPSREEAPEGEVTQEVINPGLATVPVTTNPEVIDPSAPVITNPEG